MTVSFLDPMFILNTEIALGFADVNTEMEAKRNKFAIEQIYKIVSPHHSLKRYFRFSRFNNFQKAFDLYKYTIFCSRHSRPLQVHPLEMIDFALVGKLGSSLIAQTEKFGENKNIQICGLCRNKHERS